MSCIGERGERSEGLFVSYLFWIFFRLAAYLTFNINIYLIHTVTFLRKHSTTLHTKVSLENSDIKALGFLRCIWPFVGWKTGYIRMPKEEEHEVSILLFLKIFLLTEKILSKHKCFTKYSGLTLWMRYTPVSRGEWSITRGSCWWCFTDPLSWRKSKRLSIDTRSKATDLLVWCCLFYFSYWGRRAQQWSLVNQNSLWLRDDAWKIDGDVLFEAMS